MVLLVFVYWVALSCLESAGAAEAGAAHPSTFNVGSVLFSAPDVKKSCWSKGDLALLRTRSILQGILPPKDSIDINDEGYVDCLIGYFNHGFEIALRNSDTEPDSSLIVQAMADTVGGYLKSWALPVTRFGFYAGTVSYEAVSKLTEYYNDIKSSLSTDGYTWCCPDCDILNCVNLRIDPVYADLPAKRDSKACKELIFIETSPSQFQIPMPHVNWEYRPHMMMVPLKKRSLVALECPSAAYILYDYYIMAQRCLAEPRNADQKQDFQSRFHGWLVADILPHLKDDTLYVAFGSALRLLNGTDDLASMYRYDVPQNKRFSASDFRMEMPKLYLDSTSMSNDSLRNVLNKIPIFIGALLILWCGPCLLYLYFNHMVCKTRSHYHRGDVEASTLIHHPQYRRRSRSSKRLEHNYPCEIVYSGKKDNIMSSCNDSSKTSSDIKSNSSSRHQDIKTKTSELLFKVTRANNVNSVNFERTPRASSISRNHSNTRTSVARRRSSLKMDHSMIPKTSVTQFDLDLNDIEADRFSEIINYFSSACTRSEDIVSGECIDIPTSVSTLVQNDEADPRLSITDCSVGVPTSLGTFEMSRGGNKIARSYPDVGATEAAATAAAQGVMSSRREQDRPTRIPQKPRSTVKPRGSSRAPQEDPGREAPPPQPGLRETDSGN